MGDCFINSFEFIRKWKWFCHRYQNPILRGWRSYFVLIKINRWLQQPAISHFPFHFISNAGIVCEKSFFPVLLWQSCSLFSNWRFLWFDSLIDDAHESIESVNRFPHRMPVLFAHTHTLTHGMSVRTPAVCLRTEIVSTVNWRQNGNTFKYAHTDTQTVFQTH